MGFVSIDEAVRECRTRKYHVNGLMQISAREWRFSIRTVAGDNVWRDGQTAMHAVNELFAAVDDRAPKAAEDYV